MKKCKFKIHWIIKSSEPFSNPDSKKRIWDKWYIRVHNVLFQGVFISNCRPQWKFSINNI